MFSKRRKCFNKKQFNTRRNLEIWNINWVKSVSIDDVSIIYEWFSKENTFPNGKTIVNYDAFLGALEERLVEAW